MTDWTPPPEPVEWVLAKPVECGSTTYTTVTLHAPTSADMLKASAVRSESNATQTLRLISSISAEQIPFEALLRVPTWQIEQMTNYFEAFNGAPMPGPLAEWLKPAAPADSTPQSA